MTVLAPLGKFREPVDRLLENRNDVPMSMRWGLYEGRSLFPSAQRLFCTEIKRGVVDSVVRSMERQLAQGKSTGDYDSLYKMLKAELMMSLEPGRADADFLAGEVVGQAVSGGQIAHGSESAIEPDLRTYAQLLTQPEQQEYCLVRTDPGIIRQARAYLRDATADDKIYSNLKATAGRGLAAVNYNGLYPNDAVHENTIVPGEFTAVAWSRMQALLDQPEKLVSTESAWVLGEKTAAPIDTRALSSRLRVRYTAEYEGKWRDYLNPGQPGHETVARYANPEDAARKLELMTSIGNRSTLLLLFQLAGQNTAVGEPVTTLFEPVRELVAKPGDFSPGLPYLGLLTDIKVALQGAMLIKQDPGSRSGFRSGEGRRDKGQSGGGCPGAVEIQIGYRACGESDPARPLTQVDDLMNAAGAADLKSAGAGLCDPYNSIYSKFPFSPEATAGPIPKAVLRCSEKAG